MSKLVIVGCLVHWKGLRIFQWMSSVWITWRRKVWILVEVNLMKRYPWKSSKLLSTKENREHPSSGSERIIQKLLACQKKYYRKGVADDLQLVVGKMTTAWNLSGSRQQTADMNHQVDIERVPWSNWGWAIACTLKRTFTLKFWGLHLRAPLEGSATLFFNPPRKRVLTWISDSPFSLRSFFQATTNTLKFRTQLLSQTDHMIGTYKCLHVLKVRQSE
jgi:hypothetical protein